MILLPWTICIEAILTRSRLVISDGVAFIQAMIASQLNHIITSEEIAKNGLLQLDEFVCNLVRSRK